LQLLAVGQERRNAAFAACFAAGVHAAAGVVASLLLCLPASRCLSGESVERLGRGGCDSWHYKCC
jgi:hypothetical protein